MNKHYTKYDMTMLYWCVGLHKANFPSCELNWPWITAKSDIQGASEQDLQECFESYKSLHQIENLGGYVNHLLKHDQKKHHPEAQKGELTSKKTDDDDAMHKLLEVGDDSELVMGVETWDPAYLKKLDYFRCNSLNITKLLRNNDPIVWSKELTDLFDSWPTLKTFDEIRRDMIAFLAQRFDGYVDRNPDCPIRVTNSNANLAIFHVIIGRLNKQPFQIEDATTSKYKALVENAVLTLYEPMMISNSFRSHQEWETHFVRDLFFNHMSELLFSYNKRSLNRVRLEVLRESFHRNFFQVEGLDYLFWEVFGYEPPK